jgi:hypothetical protein
MRSMQFRSLSQYTSLLSGYQNWRAFSRVRMSKMIMFQVIEISLLAMDRDRDCWCARSALSVPGALPRWGTLRVMPSASLSPAPLLHFLSRVAGSRKT